MNKFPSKRLESLKKAAHRLNLLDSAYLSKSVLEAYHYIKESTDKVSITVKDDTHPNRNKLLLEISRELDRARSIPGNIRFICAHHGFAVLKEEVDGLWDEVRKKKQERDRNNMRKECIQIAAMAIRMIEDLNYLGTDKLGGDTKLERSNSGKQDISN